MQEHNRTGEQLHSTGQGASRTATEDISRVLQRNQEESYRRSLALIYAVFSSRERESGSAGHALYDTMARLCRQLNISIASYEQVQAHCGSTFSVTDVAELSHFTVRAVRLEEKWYHQDAGPFLAYDRESGEPMACIPEGPDRYVVYRSDGHAPIRVDAAYARRITTEAWVLYRPFPDRAMDWRDLLQFGLQYVYRSDIVRAVVLTLLGTLIGLLLSWLNERVYDDLIPLGKVTHIYGVCGVVLACALGNVCFSIVQNLVQFRSMSTMKVAVQSATYDRLFHLPESMLSRYDTADLAKRAQGVAQIYNIIADSFIGAFLAVIFSLLYLWRMFRYSADMSLIAVLMLAAAVAYMSWQGIRETRLERRIFVEDVKAHTILYQAIAGISRVRTTGVEDRILYRYMQPYAASNSMDMTRKRYQRYSDTVVTVGPLILSIVLYFVMVRGDIEMTVGSFMGFNTAFGAFSAAVIAFVSAVIQTDDIIPIYEHCLPILQAVPEYHEGTIVPEALTGEMELDHVSFAYDAEMGDVLHEVSLRIQPGECVGIVGSSGAGKSTLLELLLGFWQPRIGKIYYDGQDLLHLDKTALRGQCGVVLQNSGLIPGSILDNITIGNPGISMERVMEVLREVGLADAVAQLPDGVRTNLLENVGMSSGGQRQQVLLARAFVGRPRILFLDEAMSAIDNPTQARIMECLRQLPMTRVIIAHRLSTIQYCDRILVMDEGQIVEEGSYEELMERRGRFYEMAQRQVI